MPAIACLIGCHVQCALIGMSHKPAAYIIQTFEQVLSTSWWMQMESAQVSTTSE